MQNLHSLFGTTVADLSTGLRDKLVACVFMSTDREVVQELDAKIKEDRKSASPRSLYNAGMFFWLLGRNDKAREYIDRMIKLSNGAREASFGISHGVMSGVRRRRRMWLFLYLVSFKV